MNMNDSLIERKQNMEINIPTYRSKQNFSKTNIYDVLRHQESETNVILNKLKSVNVDSKTTSLIFFERESTDEIYLYQGDIEVRAVMDDKFNEELDTATINLVHSKNNDFLSYLIPNNTKAIYIPQVKIDKVIDTILGLQFVNFDKLFTFDNDGKPINHKQYIVCGGSINFGKNIVKHQYGLVEPTAILRLGYTGTNSHTNMPRAVIYDTQGNSTEYTQDETNLYSIIERQFKITELKTSIEDRTWYRHFNINAEYLKYSGIGISESFNNATLYDSMFKIGKYIKSYPVVYFNKDYDPNNIEKKEFNLFFESYELRNQKRIQLDSIKYLESNWSIVNSTGRFTNHVVCEAENIIPTQEIVYPYEEEYVGLTGDTNEITLGESGEHTTLPYYLRVGKRIHSVKEVIMIIVNGDQTVALGVVSYGLTDKIRQKYDAIEYSDWLLLSSSAREKTAYYTIGDNKIFVGHLKYIKDRHASRNLNIYIGRVNYKPLINAKIEFGSGDYTDIYNQTDSNLDGNMFGNYVQEYAKSQVNYDVLFQAAFENYEDIPESGTIIENNGAQLIIVSRKILVNKTSFYVSFALNYFEPKRSELINASKKITKTFVDSSKAFTRLINWKETVFVDVAKSINGIVNQRPNYFKSYKSIVPFCNNDEFKLNSAYIKFYYDSPTINNELNRIFAISLSNSVIGTSIVVNFSTENAKVFGIFGGFIELNKKNNYGKNQIADYTDIFGKVKKFDLIFCNAYENESKKTIDIAFDDAIKEYDKYPQDAQYEQNKYNIFIDFGEYVEKYISSFYTISTESFEHAKEKTSIFELSELEILKDTNETLNFTYQIELLSKNKNKLMIFNNFAKFSNFINKKNTDFSYDLLVAEVPNGMILDETTQKIRNNGLSCFHAVIEEIEGYDNAYTLRIFGLKFEKTKKYVLMGVANNEVIPTIDDYYPLILFNDIESTDFDSIESSSLILYLTNDNI